MNIENAVENSAQYTARECLPRTEAVVMREENIQLMKLYELYIFLESILQILELRLNVTKDYAQDYNIGSGEESEI